MAAVHQQSLAALFSLLKLPIAQRFSLWTQKSCFCVVNFSHQQRYNFSDALY